MEKISITGILRTPSGHPYKTRIRVNCISSSIAVPNTFMEYTSDHMGSYSFYLVPGTYNIQVEFNRRFIDFGLLTVKPEDIKEVFNLQEIIERTKEESELEEDLEKVITFKKYILNTLYPVGSIYTSFENKNPREFLGGTWELIQSGYVKIGGNSAQGGSNSISLTSSNIPFTFSNQQIATNAGDSYVLGPWRELHHKENGPDNGSHLFTTGGFLTAIGAYENPMVLRVDGVDVSYKSAHDYAVIDTLTIPVPPGSTASWSMIGGAGPDTHSKCVMVAENQKIESSSITATIITGNIEPSRISIEPAYTRVFMFKRIDAPEDAEDFDLASSINSLLKKPAESISASSTALVTSKAVALELERYLKVGQIAEITDEDIDWILS